MSEESEKAVRGMLGAWASSLPGHPHSDFAAKLALRSVEEHPSFVLRLMTVFDSRGDPKPCWIPLKEGEPPPPSGDVWSVPAGLEADFYRHETRLAVAVSTEPVACPRCEGGGKLRCKACAGTKRTACPACAKKGKKGCPQCGGLGKLACSSCQGKGMVLASVSAVGRDHETACQACHGTGGPPCPACGDAAECPACANARFVACEPCGGEGGVACSECAGQGKVYKGSSYAVEYQPILEREVRVDPALPEGLLPKELPKDDLGAIVFDEVRDLFDGPPEALPDPALAPMVAALLKRGEEGKRKFKSEARAVKQRLSIDRIPSYFVVYEFEGKRYLCWASALGGAVRATESPFTDHAGRLVAEAQRALSSGKAPQAEELLKTASALASWPWLEAMRAAAAPRPALGGGGSWVEPAVAAAATLVLAGLNRSSQHLFWPAAAFFAVTFALLKGYARLVGSRGKGLAALLGVPVLAAALLGGTALADPFRRLDAASYRGQLEARFPLPLPRELSSEDEGYLKALIALYEPLGVGVEDAREAVEANRRRIAQERAEAKRREEELAALARDEARRKAEAERAAGSIRWSKKPAPRRRGRTR